MPNLAVLKRSQWMLKMVYVVVTVLCVFKARYLVLDQPLNVRLYLIGIDFLGSLKLAAQVDGSWQLSGL